MVKQTTLSKIVGEAEMLDKKLSGIKTQLNREDLKDELKVVIRENIFDFYQFMLSVDYGLLYKLKDWDTEFVQDLSRGAANTTVRLVDDELDYLVDKVFMHIMELYKDHQSDVEIRINTMREVAGEPITVIGST